MTESLLINYSIVILFLPLLGFIVTLLLGKKLRRIYIFENIVLLASLVLSGILLFGKITYFNDVNITSEFAWIVLSDVPVFGEIKIYLGILLDDISSLMIVVVML